MRLERANLSRFKNHTYTTDLATLQQMFGKPKSSALATRMIKMFNGKTPMQRFSDAYGAIFNVKTLGEGIGIKGMKYEYKVKGIPNYTTTFATDTTTVVDFNLGRNNQEFNVCLSENIANQNDILYLENEQKLLVKANATGQDGKYVYKVQLFTNDPLNRFVNNDAVRAGKRVSVLTNVQPEISRVGYMQERDVLETRVNYLTKIRVGREMTSEAMMADYIVYDWVDGKEKPIFWMTGLEKTMLEQLYCKMENAIIWGESNINPDGDIPMMQTGGNQSEIGWSGDGIYEAIKREGMNEYYSEFSVALLDDMVHAMKQRNPYQNEKMNIVLMTGHQGYASFDRAMRDVLKGIAVTDGSWIFNKRGDKTDIGFKAGTYEYLDTTFTVIRNPVFDDQNQMPDTINAQGFNSRSSMFLALDVTAYDGVPNVQLLKKEGVGVITNWDLGMGGKDGKTSGNFHRTQASALDMVMYGGAVVHLPETCMILRKSNVIV